MGSKMQCRKDQNYRLVNEKIVVDNEFTNIIGYTYMAMSNLNTFDALESARQVAHFALGLLEKLNRFNAARSTDFKLTVGINIGQCVGGVIGRMKVR
jgi:class 3 adenylate cyclase